MKPGSLAASVSTVSAGRKLGTMSRIAAATSARTEANFQVAKRSIRLSAYPNRAPRPAMSGARRVLLGRRLGGWRRVLDRFALRAHLGDARARQSHLDVGCDLELHLIVVDRFCVLADETTGPDDDVAAPGRLHQFALLLGAALLRAPEHEIDNRDHRHDRHELDQRVRRAGRHDAAGLGEGGGYPHLAGAPATRKPRRFI